MPINKKHKAPFFNDSFYHVYNRSVEGQLLFYSAENYHFFLKQFDYYLSDLVRVYSWSLLPNHFHFLLSIKSDIECRFTDKELNMLNAGRFALTDLVSRRFKNLFISYSLALKKWYSIKTNVFAQKFKHILVDDESYFSKLVYYIHHNPAKHNIVTDWRNYPWSSYKRILTDVNTNLEFGYLMDWFGGESNFIKYHEMQYDLIDWQIID